MPLSGRVALIVGCLLGGVVAAAQTPRSGAFAVGVLRRDGIVIPFADYDGRKWRSIWPEPRVQVDVPIHLRHVPSRWWGKTGPHDTWQTWTAARPAVAVRVRQLDWFPAQCLQQVGLRTDYRSTEPPPEPGAQPFPKDGLAVAPEQPIEPIEVVPVSHLLPEPVVDAFNEAEDQAVRDERGHAARLPARKKRAAMTPKVEATYGVGDPNGTRVYYFELSKQYRDDEAERCPMVAFGAGWFIREGGAPLRKLRFDAEVVDCERYGLLYMLPLGAVRLSNRLFWIAQWSGWDFEEYGVVEIKPKGVEDVIQVVGGRC